MQNDAMPVRIFPATALIPGSARELPNCVNDRCRRLLHANDRLRKAKTAKRGSLAAQLTGNGATADDEDPLEEPLNISSRHGSILDVARSVASGMLTLRNKSITTGMRLTYMLVLVDSAFLRAGCP